MIQKISRVALIYCQSQFGKVNGKITHGLVRNSEKYEIIGIIDSSRKGEDAGMIVDGIENGMPIYENLMEALRFSPTSPTHLIFGIASDGFLTKRERTVIISAISLGLDIVSGLTQYLIDDKEIRSLSRTFGVQLIDVRKPPSLSKLHSFSGKILQVTVSVIAVLGTGCASGKRTTAVQLVQELKPEGLKAVFIATGQTGLMQGAKYGIAVDMLSSGIAAGEVENAIYEAFVNEQPDIIVMEGQGSLSHPAYTSTPAIIKGALPNAIILQHPPKRKFHGDFPDFPMPKISDEISLIEQLSGSKVIAITLNHEQMDDYEVETTVEEYEALFQVPVTDVLCMACSKVIQQLFISFPELNSARSNSTLLLK